MNDAQYYTCIAYLRIALVVTGITQHPGNDTFCERSNAVFSCVILHNTTNDAADFTYWFTDNPPVAVLSNMINNTRDGDVVTSVLTIENVSLNDNGNGYFCLPSLDIRSSVGVISVAGETVYIIIFYSTHEHVHI